MAIFEITQDSLVPVPTSTFATERIRERQDLQRLLRDNVAVVAPDTYVLAEEYGDWADARRRIDLLCLDRQANIVVVELKRTEDGGHMELQAIRYAGMVSKMTFAQAVEAHATYLQGIGREEDARAAILKFLDWDEPRESEFAQETRIVLVSGEFSKEITTAVLWLNEHELDIRCVRLACMLLENEDSSIFSKSFRCRKRMNIRFKFEGKRPRNGKRKRVEATGVDTIFSLGNGSTDLSTSATWSSGSYRRSSRKGSHLIKS